MRDHDPRRNPAWPALLATLYPMLRPVAIKYGYALTVHGSLARDLDLVACPWTEEAVSADELVAALSATADLLGVAFQNPTEKPYGRLAWALHLDGGTYIDLSVMPGPGPDLRRQTQTDTEHGNCWQTAVACVLRVPASQLPDQVAIESGSEKRHGYHNALCEYLIRHHRLMYYELQAWQRGAVTPRASHLDGYHVLVGPTERSPNNGGLFHVVVAKSEVMVWDPHPSGAGLTRSEKWGYLSPVPDSFSEQRKRSAEKRPESYRCLCPECGE